MIGFDRGPAHAFLNFGHRVHVLFGCPNVQDEYLADKRGSLAERRPGANPARPTRPAPVEGKPEALGG